MPNLNGYLTIYSSDGTEVLASGIALDRNFDLKSDGLYHSGETTLVWTAPDGFLGFSSEPNGEIEYGVGAEEFSFGTGLDDMDVCVVLEDSPTTTYSLTYVTNGGTLESGYDNPTNVANLPSPLPNCVKAKYTFEGWYYDTLYTKAAVGNDTLSEDTILYAKFIYDNSTIATSKPSIYGYCPAGCKWETVHKEDVDVLYDLVSVKQVASVDGVYEMPLLNNEYKMYVSNPTDNWGITLKLKYSLSGLTEEIDINPSTSHIWTDKDGRSYDLPIIPVDGDYLKYKIVSWETYHCSDTTNTMFIRFYIRYKTIHTEWQDDIIISEVGSGIPEDAISYVGMYATGPYKVESVTMSEFGQVKEDVADIKRDNTEMSSQVATNEANITSLRNEFDTLEPKVNKYTNRDGTDLVGLVIEGTITTPTQSSVTQSAMPSGRYEFIVTTDQGDLRFIGDIDNTTDKINVLEAEQKTSTAGTYYFIRTHYLFVNFQSIDGSAITATFYMGRIQYACNGTAVTTGWSLESGQISKVSVITR